MSVRALGTAAVTAALLLLPVGAHAAGPELATAAVGDATRYEERSDDVVTASPTEVGAAGIPSDSIIVLGLVVLVAGTLLVVLRGGRPDDDEPTD